MTVRAAPEPIVPTLAAVDQMAARVHAGIHRIHHLAAADDPWIDPDIESDLATLLDAFDKLPSPIPGAESKLDVISALVKIHRELDGFDQYLRSGELVGASVSLHEMMSALARFDEGKASIPEPYIYAILQEECINRQSDIMFQLGDVFKNVYQLKESSNGNAVLQVASRISSTSSLNFHDNPISLDDLLLALDASGMMESNLKTLTSGIVRSFVHCNSIVCTSTLLIDHNNLMATLTARQNSADTKQSHTDIDSLLGHLMIVAKFSAEHIFTSSFRPPSCFIASLTSAFVQAIFIVTHHLITENRLDDESLMNTVESIFLFEQKLEEIGMWNSSCESLSKFARTLSRRQAAAASNSILSDVSTMLDSIDDNIVDAPELLLNVVPGISGSLFEGGKKGASTGKNSKNGSVSIQQDFETHGYKISQRALLLVEALDQRLSTIKFGPSDHERHTAMQLLQTTKNVLDMHRAKSMLLVSSVDVQHQTPLRIITYYCDCLFICQYLGLLDTRLLDLSNDSAFCITFSDMIPSFRNLGESVFLSYMEKIKASLQSDLNGVLTSKRISAEPMLQRIVSQINHIAREWRRVAHVDMYAKSIGVLVDYLLDSLFRQLIDLKVTDRTQLHSVRYVFLKFKPLAANFDVPLRHSDHRISVTQSCTRWANFLAIVDALDTLDPVAVQKVVSSWK
ncbi:hypothetical protein BASA50_001142 [Batrachochytrium salamandrivorans]|uniref:Uncharacterized protein n=1 Tax=Batrachochytrium salamandrivorans TaxID=1357716 RepID=A0ABQ8ERR6_9FUNG|nr:hypothetical protein BASA60_008810 [Batrachochytrium salamandrivorans]KAH6578044.1 hypothetical protein BASA62_000483 [Batrachochytrium salamandrivorans]KAH6585533.1 hypothetical protein BASA50_001142 [Batrachochytrium salamandrivorans]KAH6587114.1 hypothetical protein BASA61_006386 [Batrachochytrium salamandrivorans]KAH9248384.1 hypothetical protein BASA81_013970 [Batrachochytrium salamandrivorans]